MPQMVKSLSSTYTNRLVGLLVMIPYIAGVSAMILVSRSSDRRLERRFHGAISLVIAGVAMIALGRMSYPSLAIFLWCAIAMGISSFNGPFWALPSEFLAGIAGASGIALINSVGNLGGFFGPLTLGWIAQKTGSLYAGLSFAGVSVLVSAGLMLLKSGSSHRFSRPRRSPPSA